RLVFNPDGRLLAMAGADKQTHLWNVPKGAEEGIRVPGYPVAFSSNDALQVQDGKRIRRWDARSGTEIVTKPGPVGPSPYREPNPSEVVLARRFSGDGRFGAYRVKS